MDRYTKLAAIGFILILTSAGLFYWSLDQQNDDDNTDNPIDNTPEPVGQVPLTTTAQLQKTELREGEPLPVRFSIQHEKNITLNSVMLNISDPHYDRIAAQSVQVEKILVAGTTQLEIEFEPSFPIGEGVVLSEFNESYTITSYTLVYNTSISQRHSSTFNVDTIDILENEVHDQALHVPWQVDENGAIISQNGANFTISSGSNTQVRLQTMINATGYPRISVDGVGFDSNVNYYLNGTSLSLSGSDLSIGNYFGIQNLTITADITAGVDKQLNVTIQTKAVVLFAAIANNYWESQTSDGFYFRAPSFYIRQASVQFEKVFNVTIIPAKTFTVSNPKSTNLLDFLLNTVNETADVLNLPQDSWELGPGSYNVNEGFDILLIFTNKTMSNLGVVFGDVLNGAYNAAIHARGTLNGANIRLPPRYADNLIQHEVSHVFGAPDRYTDSSPVSIMTKSRAEDALNDFLFGDFFLYQTAWIEVDIQTMVDDNKELYW